MPASTSAHAVATRQTALLWLAVTIGTIFAQDSNVQTCEADLSWLVNSRGQTPCLLASYLQSQCQPMQVNAIPEGTHYLGPQSPAEANECVCSTVVYNLVSACGACQGRRWSSWTNWSTNCSTALISVGDPFPKGVPPAAEIPRWAYSDVTQQPGLIFDTAQALQAGTEPLSTTTSASTTPTSATVSRNQPSNNPTTTGLVPVVTNSNSASKPNPGAIAGGVVGGVVALVAIGLLVFWLVLRKRRTRVDKDFVVDTETKLNFTGPLAPSHQRGESQAPMLNNFSPPVGSSTLPSLYGVRPMSPPSSPPTYYGSGTIDMSDMGTIPMSPNSAVYTTLPSRRSFESFTYSQPSQFGSLVPVPQPQRGAGYTGAAELS